MVDLHSIKFPPLSLENHDSDAIRKKYYAQQARIVVKNLSRNNFSAHYCDSVVEARELVLSLIPTSSVIGCGDSHTIFALELDQGLEEKSCTVIAHTCAVNGNAYDHNAPGFKILGDRQQTKEILMHYLVADVFMLGANAITIDGQIINIDGAGNRIAGSLYGSDRIIVIAGANKIVKDLNSGLERIRQVAAEMNNIKYENDLACNKSGICVDCRSSSRNCNITSIIHRKPDESDFHVVVIGEELGF